MAREGRGSPALEHEIGRVLRRSRKATEDAAFRATIEERLRGLEAEVSEVKTRVNGLLFFVAGTVIAQVVLRLVA